MLRCVPRYAGVVGLEALAEGVAVVRLANPPVNSLSRGVLGSLRQAVRDAEADGAVRSVVLTSSVPGIFSAGLDLKEMQTSDSGKLAAFWTDVQEAWLALYASPLHFVAAMPGHAPAGGLMLATACDERVMARGPFLLGLNEVQFGLVAPDFLLTALVNVVGQRTAERLATSGSLVSPDEAHRIGLVDDLADDVVQTATTRARDAARLPEGPRSETKRRLRRAAVEAFRANQAACTSDFVAMVAADDTQAAVQAYVARLQAKKKTSSPSSY